MNCRPGDLAIVVKSNKRRDTSGAIVRVLRTYPADGMYCMFGPAWVVDYQGVEHHALDAWLRPIRDPGDDAVDETLLFSPVKEEAL